MELTTFHKIKSLEKYQPLCQYLDISDEDLMDIGPDDVVEYIKAQDPKLIILAKSFVKRVYYTQPVVERDGKYVALDYSQKLRSSALSSTSDSLSFQFIFNSINDNLNGESLVYLDVSQSFLLEDDLELLCTVVATYKQLQAIDVGLNKITFSDEYYTVLTRLFTSDILVNFHGNYCYNDEPMLKFVYNSPAIASGYVWIYESYFTGNGWEEFIIKFGLSEHLETIKATHSQFFKLKNKYL